MTDGTNPVASKSAIGLRRAALGLSLQQIANCAGITKTHAWQMEQGAGNPTLKTLVGLAKALQWPLQTLLDELVVCDAETAVAPPANPVIVARVREAILAADTTELLGRYGSSEEDAEHFAQAALEAMPDVVGLRGALREAESEARRFAAFYPEASDGRNSFVILADKIAALAKVSGVSKPLPDSPPRS